ncbi:MAG: inner membrane protein YpjD [Nitrospinota bacterium]
MFATALFCYFVGTLKYLLYLYARRPIIFHVGTGAVVTGFLAHSLDFVLRMQTVGHFPYGGWHDSMSALAWAIVLAYLLAQIRYRMMALGAFVLPVAFALTGYAALLPPSQVGALPGLRGLLLASHVGLALLGVGAFTVLFAGALMFILQEAQLKSRRPGALFHRLPSLSSLDELNGRALLVGFPLLTLSLVTGSLWAQVARGSFWSWDPVRTWPLVLIWLSFGLLCVLRLMKSWRGKRAALVSLVGFGAVALAYIVHI